jgi:hypothetical protein
MVLLILLTGASAEVIVYANCIKALLPADPASNNEDAN